MLQILLILLRGFLAYTGADVIVGLLAFQLCHWMPSRLRSQLNTRTGWIVVYVLFGWAIVLALVTDCFVRWGRRHYGVYLPILLLIGLTAILLMVAGFWSSDLSQVGFMVLFWFVLLLLWRDDEDPQEKAEVSR